MDRDSRRARRAPLLDDEADPKTLRLELLGELVAIGRTLVQCAKIIIGLLAVIAIMLALILAASTIVSVFALSYRSTVNGILENAGLLVRDLATPQDLTLLRATHTPEEITGAGLIMRILAKGELLEDQAMPLIRKSERLMKKVDTDLTFINRWMSAMPPLVQPPTPSDPSYDDDPADPVEDDPGLL